MMVISIIIIPILFSCAFAQQKQVESKDAKAYYQLGITQIQRGDFDQAILYFNKSIEIDPNNPMAYRDRGAAYSAKGKHDLAISDWTKALEIDPNDRTAYFNRGRTFCIIKQYDRAISDLNKTLEIDPRDADAYNERGIAYFEKGQYDLGISDFNKVIEINPNHPLAWKNLGYCYYRMKKWPEAIDKLLIARDMDPWGLGIEESLDATLNEAFSDLRKWVDDKPLEPMSHYYLSYAHLYKGESGKALKEINKAIELDSSKALFYKARGNIYYNQKKYNNAVADYERCGVLEPSSWACYASFGEISAYFLGKPKEGLEAVIKASTINPQVISVQSKLGTVYFKNKEFEKAVAALNKALSLGAKDQGTYFNLAVAYFYLKNYDMAWRCVRVAERTGSPKAGDLIKKLNQVSKEPK